MAPRPMRREAEPPRSLLPAARHRFSRVVASAGGEDGPVGGVGESVMRVRSRFRHPGVGHAVAEGRADGNVYAAGVYRHRE